eukprot:scaffold48271_cov30-Tisochrysis_lutea.AAC.1
MKVEMYTTEGVERKKRSSTVCSCFWSTPSGVCMSSRPAASARERGGKSAPAASTLPRETERRRMWSAGGERTRPLGLPRCRLAPLPTMRKRRRASIRREVRETRVGQMGERKEGRASERARERERGERGEREGERGRESFWLLRLAGSRGGKGREEEDKERKRASQYSIFVLWENERRDGISEHAGCAVALCSRDGREKARRERRRVGGGAGALRLRAEKLGGVGLEVGGRGRGP